MADCCRVCSPIPWSSTAKSVWAIRQPIRKAAAGSDIAHTDLLRYFRQRRQLMRLVADAGNGFDYQLVMPRRIRCHFIHEGNPRLKSENRIDRSAVMRIPCFDLRSMTAVNETCHPILTNTRTYAGRERRRSEIRRWNRHKAIDSGDASLRPPAPAGALLRNHCLTARRHRLVHPW
jgi:hypothetical protein